MVKGKCAIELFMGRRYFFPYNFLDEAKEQFQNQTDEYDIYFVLRGHSYRIECEYNQGSIYEVVIRDLFIDNSYKVQFDIKNSFIVPDIRYMKTEFLHNNTMLKFEYNEEGINYLKENDKEAYSIYCEAIQNNGYFRIIIHAKSILDMFFNVNGLEHNEEYDVLYIGQSKRKDIFDRLSSHSTIQKICRENYRSTNNLELYLMIHSVNVKRFEEAMLKDYNTSIISSSKLEREFNLFDTIDENCMIDIAEAMLIAHFQPIYNKKLKGRAGNEKLLTYSKIGMVEINPITFALDLYWENTKEKMILKTESITTTCKARILNCDFCNDEVKLWFEDLPDIFY